MTKDVSLNPGENMNGNDGYDKPIMPSEVLMTVVEVAKYLRLKPNTVRAMARNGKLPAIKLGRGWRFYKTALLAYVESKRKTDLLE